MPRLARFLVPTMLFASVAILPACASHKGENVDQSGDDLTTWEPATAGMPKWATPDRLSKVIDADEQMTVQVHLKLHNEDAAAAELAAISDPDNARYGQFLSDEDFEAKYAPTQADIDLVTAHLQKYGLTITHVPNNRMYVRAMGSTTQVSKAFATKFGQYQVDGALRRGPLTQPKVPRTFASKISSTLGLSQSPTYHPRNVRVGGVKQDNVKQQITAKGHPTPRANDVPPNTCAEWYGSVVDTVDPPFGTNAAQPTYALCGYTPGQVRNAYGMNAAIRKGQDGTGVKVAIVDAFLSPTLLKDAQTYAAQHDPDYPLKDSQFSIHQGPGTPDPNPDTGWYGEQSLDVEAVHTMAPGANIVYVAAQTPTDVDLVGAINMIIDQKLATIISNSYGSPEGQANDFVVWKSVTTHAGLKGIGVYFASGDNGDESANLGFVSADFPASLPTVTAVGGTTLAVGQTGELIYETGWETGAAFLLSSPSSDGDAGTDGGGTTSSWFPDYPGFFAFGAGGGTSMVYEQPDYQRGIVPDSLANIPGAPARVVPDVGMLGDPMTGFLIGMTDPNSGAYGESAIGGTSLACPLFAASMALAEQKAKGPIGFANPRIYKKRANAFRDIVPTKDPQNIAIPGGIMTVVGFSGIAINVAPGYDNVTGLGAPDGTNFLNAMKRN